VAFCRQFKNINSARPWDTVVTPLNVVDAVLQIAHFQRCQTPLFQMNLPEAPSNVVILKLPWK
jgi:hypothetical protein